MNIVWFNKKINYQVSLLKVPHTIFSIVYYFGKHKNGKEIINHFVFSQIRRQFLDKIS